MKKLYIIILFFCSNFISYAQIDFNNPPWEIGCDTMSTQIDMNGCSYEQFRIADSVLNFTYDFLLSNFDNLDNIINTSDTSDTYLKEQLQLSLKQKNAIIKSRIDFNELRKSLTDIISYQYQGGTIRPLFVNIYALDITINQIKILNNIIEDLFER